MARHLLWQVRETLMCEKTLMEEEVLTLADKHSDEVERLTMDFKEELKR